MTAQVVVMNKEAIALASDSAVTISQGNGEDDNKQKIFTSANKVFTLSKYQPLGIMVYGSAEFMDVPLETVIKVYRERLGKKSFATLREYTSDFINFMDNGNPIFPESVQNSFAEETFYSYFNYVKNLVTLEVQAVISEHGRITRKTIRRIVTEVIREQYHLWGGCEARP